MGDGCIINRVHSLSEHRFCSPAGEGKANDIAKSGWLTQRPANQTQAPTRVDTRRIVALGSLYKSQLKLLTPGVLSSPWPWPWPPA